MVARQVPTMSFPGSALTQRGERRNGSIRSLGHFRPVQTLAHGDPVLDLGCGRGHRRAAGQENAPDRIFRVSAVPLEWPCPDHLSLVSRNSEGSRERQRRRPVASWHRYRCRAPAVRSGVGAGGSGGSFHQCSADRDPAVRDVDRVQAGDACRVRAGALRPVRAHCVPRRTRARQPVPYTQSHQLSSCFAALYSRMPPPPWSR